MPKATNWLSVRPEKFKMCPSQRSTTSRSSTEEEARPVDQVRTDPEARAETTSQVAAGAVVNSVTRRANALHSERSVRSATRWAISPASAEAEEDSPLHPSEAVEANEVEAEEEDGTETEPRASALPRAPILKARVLPN